METKRNGFFTYHTLSERERKNLLILELIKNKGSISRTEISKETDINIVSISTYIKAYLDEHLVVEKGLDSSTGGRRPELVELNQDGAFIIGVDINSHAMIATVTDLTLKVMGRLKIQNPNSDEKGLESRCINLLHELINSAGIKELDIKAIGIGVADVGLIQLRGVIEKEFNARAFVGHDASCAAFGEKTLNLDADVEELLYMYSDIGCGIIIRGDIYLGAGGSAGELQISNSHISKEEEAVLIRDSKYLKPWSSELGIISSARREIEKGVGTKMVAIAKGDIANLTREVVIEAARQNDEVALYIVQNAAINLGLRIAYLVNLFNPEVVVIGGGIEKAGELVLAPIMDKIKRFAFSAQAEIVRVIPSTLGEDAVSLGAASLAVREIFLKA
ncbi:MAG: ROK family protein [Candidatus Omnitrophota bacterium]|nr:ROK family protein [Candidatus Omnitrophota bacterium]